MGWENYISTEDLQTKSTQEMLRIREKLQDLLTAKQLHFVEYKNWLLDEFIALLIWYRQHYQLAIDINSIEKNFRSQATQAETLPQVLAAIHGVMDSCGTQTDIKTLLENKYAILCLDGYLPRNFTIQVLPQILILARKSYLIFLEKADGYLTKANQTQMQLFEKLIKALSAIKTEQDAKNIIERCIKEAQELINNNKSHALWFLDDTWDHMQESLKNFHETVNHRLLDVKRKYPSDEERTSLQEAIQNIDIQMELNKQGEQEQIRRNKTYLEKRKLILLRFDQCISAAYRGTFHQKGKERDAQLIQLRNKIQQASDATIAATAIHTTIAEIEENHQGNSIGYNLVILKKQSRAIQALRHLLSECETEKLLPTIPQCKPSAVESRFAQAVHSYFAKDICFSSPPRRRLAQKLMHAIHTIDEQVATQQIRLIEGKQKIANIVELTLTEAEKLHEHGEWFTRILRLIGYKGKSRFVQELKVAAADLIKNKQLETSYQRVTWPLIEPKLEKIKQDYLRSKPVITAQDVEVTQYLDELSNSIEKAVNGEDACYLFNAGIRSFQEPYPELAAKLSETYQELRTAKILPSISHNTGFGKFLGRLREQSREAIELKHRIRGIS